MTNKEFLTWLTESPLHGALATAYIMRKLNIDMDHAFQVYIEIVRALGEQEYIHNFETKEEKRNGSET